MQYKLLLISSIPVYKIRGKFYTLNLWVRDLETQVKVVNRLCLISPILLGEAENLAPLPENIELINDNEIDNNRCINLVEKYDVIQLAANKPIWNSSTEQQFVKVASKFKKNSNCRFIE
jgi:hypothetical protein